MLASQDAALERLLRKDFGGTLLRFVDDVARDAAARRRPRSRSTSGAQFDQFERLEELRQFRPALYRALPMRAGSGTRIAPDAAAARPAARSGSRPPMIINQWVPAAHAATPSATARARVRDMLRAAGHDVGDLRADDRRRPARRRAAVRRSGGARAATSRSSTSRCRRR